MTYNNAVARKEWLISIHTLRMEGDSPPTPVGAGNPISIHTLRMEGDYIWDEKAAERGISIHTLRMEGDPAVWSVHTSGAGFQSTPSAWRVTASGYYEYSMTCISIHTLRMEGD